MLDTNILVDFVLIYWKIEKNEQIPKHLLKASKVLKKFESSNFTNYMSCWNKFELRDVIMQLRLQQKWVLVGYSTREFGDAKKDISLTPTENNLVNQIVADIWSFSLKKTIDLKSNDKLKIEKINKQGFSFMDILLILQAEKLNCDFFVTKEKALRNSRLLKNEFNTKIIGIRELLDKLR